MIYINNYLCGLRTHLPSIFTPKLCSLPYFTSSIQYAIVLRNISNCRSIRQ